MRRERSGIFINYFLLQLFTELKDGSWTYMRPLEQRLRAAKATSPAPATTSSDQHPSNA